MSNSYSLVKSNGQSFELPKGWIMDPHRLPEILNTPLSLGLIQSRSANVLQYIP